MAQPAQPHGAATLDQRVPIATIPALPSGQAPGPAALFAPGQVRQQPQPWLGDRAASGVYSWSGRSSAVRQDAPVLATPGRRLAGAAIDAIGCGLLGSVPWIFAIRPRLRQITTLAQQHPGLSVAGAIYHQVLFGWLTAFALAWLASAAIAVAYHWLTTVAFGCTIGKRIAGTAVISERTWRKPRPGAAFYRALMFILSPLLCGVFLLADVGWLLRDPRRQCLHDKAARTLVIDRRTAPAR